MSTGTFAVVLIIGILLLTAYLAFSSSEEEG